jgi:hypothetical protein
LPYGNFFFDFFVKNDIKDAKFMTMGKMKKREKEKKVHINDHGLPTHEKPSTLKKIKKRITLKLNSGDNSGIQYDDCI